MERALEMNSAGRKLLPSSHQSLDSPQSSERWANPFAPTASESTKSTVSSSRALSDDGSQQPSRTRQLLKTTFSSILPVNSTASRDGRGQRPKGNRDRRLSGSSSVRTLDFTRGPEISQQPSQARRRSSLSYVRYPEPTNALETLQNRRRSSFSSVDWRLHCNHSREPSSLPCQARRKYSLSARPPNHTETYKQSAHLSSDLHSSAVRTLDYTNAETQKPSTHNLSGASLLHSSASRNLDYTHTETRKPYPHLSGDPGLHSSAVRTLNYTNDQTKNPYARLSSDSQLHSSATRALDYTNVQTEKPSSNMNGDSQLHSSATRNLDYTHTETNKPSPHPSGDPGLHSAARTLDYTHAESQAPSPHLSGDSGLHSSAARTLDYTNAETQKPSQQLRRDAELHSSAARTLDYIKHSENDQMRRDRSESKSRSLDYMRRGKTSEQPSQVDSGSSSFSKARPLDYTHAPAHSWAAISQAASFPQSRAIDYTTEPPPPQMRRTSSASKVRALDFIHDGEEQIDNARSQAAFSNIRMLPDENLVHYVRSQSTFSNVVRMTPNGDYPRSHRQN